MYILYSYISKNSWRLYCGDHRWFDVTLIFSPGAEEDLLSYRRLSAQRQSHFSIAVWCVAWLQQVNGVVRITATSHDSFGSWVVCFTFFQGGGIPWFVYVVYVVLHGFEKSSLLFCSCSPSLVAIVNGSMSLERLLIRYEFENRQARHWNAGNFTCSLILKLVNDEEFLWSLWPESSRTI